MSQDSRNRVSLGYVPTEQLVGKAMTVLFTFKSCKKEPTLTCPSTWDRWMKPL
jgi:signal peptidase I